MNYGILQEQRISRVAFLYTYICFITLKMKMLLNHSNSKWINIFLRNAIVNQIQSFIYIFRFVTVKQLDFTISEVYKVIFQTYCHFVNKTIKL